MESLVQSLLESHDQLVLVMERGQPAFANRAFLAFFGLGALTEFKREIGMLEYRFVPHDSYFHAGKIESDELWFEALSALPAEERIVSMLSAQMVPHAFEVRIIKESSAYVVALFRDVTKELIKRILIQNDASTDKVSGAYSREYFVHTSASLQDAADFNKKHIYLTSITLDSMISDEASIRSFVTLIKQNIRADDMLVRWNEKTFVLAYLVDSESFGDIVTMKLEHLLKYHQEQNCPQHSCTLKTIVPQPSEPLSGMIKRALL